MKFDFDKLDVASLSAVIKTADSQGDHVDDDIVAQIYGDDKAGYDEYLAKKGNADDSSPAPQAPTVKDISKMIAKSHGRRRKLGDYPKAIKEEEDPNILIRGAWLERGGSAFIVSTAGTGKSILVTQFSVSMVHGVPVCGLKSYRPLKCWIVQSEDSDRRVAIDRDDIISGLSEQWKGHKEFGGIDWESAANSVEFIDLTGYTGATFVEQLRNELQTAKDEGDLPDVVVINPFMDFLGADVTSNADVIAFLSGGVIGGKRTEGLRSVLHDFKIAALVVHHTGKPPTDKELNSWICSDMPEYKACGASYITNWGRSFVTMMKIPGMEGFVMLTAGKNGGGLGWPLVCGSRRIFLRWGGGESCSGTGQRHYWRVVDGEDYDLCVSKIAEISGERSGRKADEKPQKEAIDIKAAAHFWACEIVSRDDLRDIGTNDLRNVIFDAIRRDGRTRLDARMIFDELSENASVYGLKIVKDKFGRKTFVAEAEDEI